MMLPARYFQTPVGWNLYLSQKPLRERKRQDEAAKNIKDTLQELRQRGYKP